MTGISNRIRPQSPRTRSMLLLIGCCVGLWSGLLSKSLGRACEWGLAGKGDRRDGCQAWKTKEAV